MKVIGILGRILYGLPFIVFGTFHFFRTEGMAQGVLSGWPLADVLVIITGIALVLAGIAAVFKIQVRLAMILLGILLFIFVVAIHLPGMINAADQQAMQQSMNSLLKDLSLGGAAWFIASRYDMVNNPTDK
ncbi:MAG: DoxX family protein [Bacteroidales bacterium]